MKRTLLVIFCISSLLANAQQFRYGFSIAPAKNILNLQSDLYNPAESYRGFQYGLLFDQTFGKGEHIGLGLGINLNYTNSGLSTIQESAADDFKEWAVRGRYLEVPLTLKLRTGQIGNFVFYGEGGASYGKCIRAVGDYTVNGVRRDSDFDFIDKGNGNGLTYEPMNASLIFGLGTEIAVTEDASIIIGFFMAKGLVSVYEDNNLDSELMLNQTGIKIAGLF
ncbi:MAG: outer membrane beta-barrel protein [Bacteroidetes bacterium]|nr:outer membrane beta-barrel protein [Bacteroidota bacterium]